MLIETDVQRNLAYLMYLRKTLAYIRWRVEGVGGITRRHREDPAKLSWEDCLFIVELLQEDALSALDKADGILRDMRAHVLTDLPRGNKLAPPWNLHCTRMTEEEVYRAMYGDDKRDAVPFTRNQI